MSEKLGSGMPREWLEHRVVELQRELKRSYGHTLALVPEGARRLQALLAKQVKDDAGLVAEENAILVNDALINDLLKLVQEEATRKLAMLPTPRMVIETKGEARTIVEMMQRQMDEQKQELAEARALLERLLKAKERLWNGAEEWSEVSAYLAQHKEEN